MSLVHHCKKDALAIFLLHGVLEKNEYQVRNYTRKHIEQEYFYKIMKELKSAGTPLSLDEVIELKQNNKAYPDKAYAVTFDDGFENNYSVAAPILDDLDVPATFYITTGFVDKNMLSWIDQIEILFETTRQGVLKLQWNENKSHFSDIESKKLILDEIRNEVKANPDIIIKDFVADIYHQLGEPVVHASDDPLDLKLSWDQLTQMENNQLFTIGGHTHSHPIMSFLSQDELDFEIDTSLEYLKTKAKIVTHHYSYPEGQEYCFNSQVIKALESRGITCCPTAIEGINLNEDLFHLKRINVI